MRAHRDAIQMMHRDRVDLLSTELKGLKAGRKGVKRSAAEEPAPALQARRDLFLPKSRCQLFRH